MLATGSRDRDNQGAALEHRSAETATDIVTDSHISPADIRVTIAPSEDVRRGASPAKAGQFVSETSETPDGSPVREGSDRSRAVGFGRGGGGETLHAHDSGGDHASNA
jgi:hypothetical protein